MFNNFVLVGKLLEVNEKEKSLILAVQRPYKNENNIYENDFIKIHVKVCFDNFNDYLKISDLLGVKGRIETDKNNNLILESEKITFLSHGSIENVKGGFKNVN